MFREEEVSPAAPLPGRDDERSRRRRRWSCFALFAILPPALIVLGFARPPLETDSLFYGYQLKHAGELNGRWWKLGDDPTLGYPYQNELARHAGLYEGVDLMLIAAGPSRFLDARLTYFLAAAAALLINAWVAGWLALRLTRSPSWAALSVVLITWNFLTVVRFLEHLHLVKFGWFLLAVWAFARYLAAPDVRRGFGLGLALALVLQGSFYFGYFALLVVGVWWLGSVIAGRVGREHVGATAVAGLTFGVSGFALTFPVWTLAKGRYFADDFLQRPWRETWIYGSELWQYVVPHGWPVGMDFINQVNGRPPGTYGEGWNFPGFTILVAVAVYAGARLRGWRLWPTQARFLDLAMGLMGLLVLLSLAGGPSFFLFKFRPFSGFRSYGRAGLLAMALGSLVAPVVFQGVVAAIRPRGLRVAAVAMVLALAACDARTGLRYISGHVAGAAQRVERRPAWTRWLEHQPAGVRLAAFSPSDRAAIASPMYWWGINSAAYRLQHGHATLNGSDLRLFEADLKLLGASHDRMNEDGLRFVVALGYDTLAFDRHYLAANPWIETLPWLEWLERKGGWRIARAHGEGSSFSTRTLGQLLAAQPEAAADRPIEVPIESWITGRLAVAENTVIRDDRRVFLTWVRADGKRLRTPLNALFQHVFGPEIPAYRVMTPQTPGDYALVFEDEGRNRLAAIRYRVSRSIRTPRQAGGGRSPEIGVNILDAGNEPGGSAPYLVEIENTSGMYLQARTVNQGTSASVCAHPGLFEPGPGSLLLWLHAREEGRAPTDVNVALPFDLPPGGRLTLRLAADRVPRTGRDGILTIMPVCSQLEIRPAPVSEAGLKLSLTRGQSPQLAGSTSPATDVRR